MFEALKAEAESLLKKLEGKAKGEIDAVEGEIKSAFSGAEARLIQVLHERLTAIEGVLRAHGLTPPAA